MSRPNSWIADIFNRGRGFIRRDEFERVVKHLRLLHINGEKIMADIEALKLEVHQTRAVIDRAVVAFHNLRDKIAELIERLKGCGVDEQAAIAEAVASLDAGQAELEAALGTGGSLGGVEE